MRLKNNYVTCVICGYRGRREKGNQRRFMAKFPLNEARCREWVRLAGQEDLAYIPIEKLNELKHICGEHFRPSDFNKTQSRLKRFAVPSLYLKAPPLAEEILTDFPCHLFSENEISTKPNTYMNECVSKPAWSPDNTMAGPSDFVSEPRKPNLPHLIHHDYIHSTVKKHLKSSLRNDRYARKNKLASGNGLTQEEYVGARGGVAAERARPYPAATRLEGERAARTGAAVQGGGLPQEEHADAGGVAAERARPYPAATWLEDEQTANGDWSEDEQTADGGWSEPDSAMQDIEESPQLKKLSKKLLLAKQKISSLKQGNILPHIKSSALQALINSHIRNNTRTSSGKRFTTSEKALASAIYKKSPRAYKHLRRLITLPSVSTLQNHVQNIEIEPGISPIVLDHLKKIAGKLEEKDKLCSLHFDEIALKKQLIFNPRTDKVEGFVDLGENQFRSSDMATHALVFILQCLHKNIKQTIAYFFVEDLSSEILAILIAHVIKAVTDIGYTVITTVCDQGSTKIESLNLLKTWCDVPIESNYFIVNAEKIFIMFDIPYLFKTLRDNFKSGQELVIDGIVGKWSHLLDVVKLNKSTLHFRKLTGLHVKLSTNAKRKVKLAAQLLSNTVAGILKLMAEKYRGDGKGREILGTAQIVEGLDRLFDCTNGPAHAKDVIRNRRENVSKKTQHLEMWAHYKNKLSTMHFVKNYRSLRLKNERCVEGFVTSLSTLEDVWKLLESKGFNFLNLRQLNQECLEQCFGMIRKYCPTNNNPTCFHFTSTLKSNIVKNLSPPIGNGANWRGENEAILNFEDFVQDDSDNVQSPDNVNATNPFPLLIILEDVAEYFRLDNTLLKSFDKKPTIYVAGYLAYLVLKKMSWQCEQCKSCLRIEIPELMDETTYNCVELREWWHDKTITYPTINLCALVDKAKACFELEIKHLLCQRHLINEAITTMLTKLDDTSWMCVEHRDRLLRMVLAYISYVLIQDECQRINYSLVSTEEFTEEENEVLGEEQTEEQVEEQTEEQIEELVEEQIEEQVEEQVEEQIEEQIEELIEEIIIEQPEEPNAEVNEVAQQQIAVQSIQIDQIVFNNLGEAYFIEQ